MLSLVHSVEGPLCAAVALLSFMLPETFDLTGIWDLLGILRLQGSSSTLIHIFVRL